MPNDDNLSSDDWENAETIELKAPVNPKTLIVNNMPSLYQPVVKIAKRPTQPSFSKEKQVVNPKSLKEKQTDYESIKAKIYSSK